MDTPRPISLEKAPRRRSRPPWWSVALLGIAAAVALFAGWRWVAGSVVDATVVSHDDTSCRVEWADPDGGPKRQGDLGCLDTDMPGDRIRVLAQPGAHAATVRDAVLGPATIVGILCTTAAIGIVLRAHPPRRRRTRRAGPPAQPPADVPGLAPGEVVYSRVGEVMTARATAEGWGGEGTARMTPDPTPQPRHWWQVKVLRGVATMIIGRILVPAIVLGMTVLLGFGSWLTTATLATADTAVVYGRVEDVGGRPLPFLPYETRLHFHVDGRWAYATVPVTRRLTEGQAVSVLYAEGHHGRARLEADGDGLNRKASATAVVAALALGLIAGRLLRLRRELAGLLRARAGPGRPWRYVRFIDPLGGAGLMLFSRLDDGPPVALLPLAPLGDAAAGFPVTGEAEVHGEVVDHGLAVPVIGGRTCWPLGRAAAVPPEIVRCLVNGDLPTAPRTGRPRRRIRPS